MFKRTTSYIISTDNRKHQKLLDVQIQSNIESGQNYTVTRESADVRNNNSIKVLFPTSADGRKMINEDDRKSDEGREKYVIKIDNDKLKHDFENELRKTSENAPDNKLDLVAYIKECSNEQHHI